MEGFNISFKFKGKTLIGRTQEDLSISAVIKESLTKDDKGAKQKVVVAHDVTVKVAGLIDPTKGPDEARLTRDEVMAMSLATGAEAVVEVQYLCNGCDTYKGNGIITGYTESSGADASSDPTYGLDVAISGEFSKVVVL